MKDIAIGTQGTAELDVEFKDTAAALDSALPEVYATPCLVRLVEAACRNAIDPYLEDGEGSVGSAVNIKHLAGSPTGFHVTARAKVTNVKGRIIDFDVEACDDEEPVCSGTHTRAVINKEKHAARIAEKKARKENK